MRAAGWRIEDRARAREEKSVSESIFDDLFVLELANKRAAELEARLKSEVKKNPLVVVRVRADENVIHKYVAGILELVRESGVSKLSIATQVRAR